MKLQRTLVTAAVSTAVLTAAMFIPTHTAGAAGSDSLTGDGTFTVPSGITELTVKAVGAPGGVCPSGAHPGYGAIVDATISVTPGETITVRVGGQGGTGSNSAGGVNGGGTGGSSGSGGGGATDIRRGGTSLGDRVVVAGGGGGCYNNGGYYGGHGGQPDGADGEGGMAGGKGGTQSAGGDAGLYEDPGYGINGEPGSFGQGGAGYCCEYPGGGGGGGGGWYGGGGGAYSHSAGGGGSSYTIAGSTDVTYSRALNMVEVPRVDISWADPPETTTTSEAPTTTGPTTTAVPTTTTTSTPTAPAPTAGYGEEGSSTVRAPEGGTVQITGRNWRPGSEVTVTVAGSVRLGALRADAEGRIAGSFALPSTLTAGEHDVTLAGTGADGSPSTVVLGLTVSAAPADATAGVDSPAGGSLAFTG